MSELRDPLRLDSQRTMLSVHDSLEANRQVSVQSPGLATISIPAEAVD